MTTLKIITAVCVAYWAIKGAVVIGLWSGMLAHMCG
jgi:hypothetical protein